MEEAREMQEPVTFTACRAGVQRPQRATGGSVGYDLRAAVSTGVEPGSWEAVPVGYRCTLPDGWAGLICPRSGLAVWHGLTVLNAPGVLDPDYTDELQVLLVNHGPYPVAVTENERIAQLVIVPCLTGGKTLQPARMGGFGSTGRA